MTFHPAIRIDRPHWLQADSTADATDWWLELTDPENERGEVCTAYFDHAEETGLDDTHAHAPVIVPTLTGIDISGVYWNRERIYRVLDREADPAVQRLEAAQGNTVHGV